MLGILQKYVIGKSLEAHNAKFINMDEAAEGLSKSVLAETSFMTLIATLAKRKGIRQWRK